MVVDDEVGIRELLVEILRDEGYQVTAAADGDSARRAWLETNPDLVLLDIWLPGADGVTLLKEWRAKERSAAVIAMSGHATIDTAVEAVKHGAADVLEKPIAMSRLLAAIKKCLAKASAPRMSPVLESAEFGSSPAMMKMKKQLATASMDQAPVLFVAGLGRRRAFFRRVFAPAGAAVRRRRRPQAAHRRMGRPAERSRRRRDFRARLGADERGAKRKFVRAFALAGKARGAACGRGAAGAGRGRIR